MPKLMIIDDSPTARLALRRALAHDPDIEIVAEAGSGRAALDGLAKHHVELVLMDMYLDRESGLELAKQIMRRHPTPILVVTGTDVREPKLALRVIEAGALDIVAKPSAASAPDYERDCRRLCRLVKTLADIPVVTRTRGSKSGAVNMQRGPVVASVAGSGSPEVVLIGASTGGPPIIRELLAALPLPFPLPIVIVQHVAAGFAAGLAEWLATGTGQRVRVCGPNQALVPGEVVIAADERHVRVLPGWRVGTVVGPPRDFQRPSVNELFESGAALLGAAAIGVLLTGMGRDGVEGLGALQRVGALTIAQRPDTCAVDSMPRLAIERGFVARVLTPDELVASLIELARRPAESSRNPTIHLAPLGANEEHHV